MKRRMFLLLLTVLLTAGLRGAAIAQVTITVDAIEQDVAIRGTVTGLPPGQNQLYKVLVYVHTDVWYIHPYAGQGEGKSWAAIDANGKWQLETVRRGFKADRLAVLVVKKTLNEPAKTENVESIAADGRLQRTLTGTDDDGKL